MSYFNYRLHREFTVTDSGLSRALNEAQQIIKKYFVEYKVPCDSEASVRELIVKTLRRINS